METPGEEAGEGSRQVRPLFGNTQRADPAASVSLATPRTQGTRTSRGPAAQWADGRAGRRAQVAARRPAETLGLLADTVPGKLEAGSGRLRRRPRCRDL